MVFCGNLSGTILLPEVIVDVLQASAANYHQPLASSTSYDEEENYAKADVPF